MKAGTYNDLHIYKCRVVQWASLSKTGMARSATCTRQVDIRAARAALELKVGNTMVEMSVLKKQFKIMCFKYHPDRCKDPNINANDKFIEIREAYDFMSGKSTSFAAQTHTKVKKWHTSPPKPRSSPPKPRRSADGGGAVGANKNKSTADIDQARLADETLMPVMNAMDVLGIHFNAKMGVLQSEVLEDTYQRTVLKLYLRHKNHELGMSACDEKLESASTAYERILLHINFKKHWTPPYERNYRRVQQRKRENAIISEYVKRQDLLEKLQKLQEIQKDIQGRARLKAERDARFHETAREELKKADDAKHATEHAKQYGGMYSASHGQRYKDELEKQSKRQIDQQYVAQEQHAVDHSLSQHHHHHHVKTTSRKRRACSTGNADDESRTPASKRPRGGGGGGASQAEAAAANDGQREDDPIVIEDSSSSSNDGDDSDDEDYEDHVDGPEG